MIRLIAAAGVAVFCCATAWSQAYVEASGQTEVFTLTAGAKAAWDQTPSAIQIKPAGTVSAKSSLTVAFRGNECKFSVVNSSGRSAMLRVYDMRGREVWHTAIGPSATTGNVSHRFAAGHYAVRLSSGTDFSVTTSFVAAGN